MLNMSLCHLKLEEYDKCVDLCKQVLEDVDGKSVKAMFRAATALSK